MKATSLVVRLVGAGCAAACVACEPTPVMQPAVQLTSATAASGPPRAAQHLVTQASACWLGGLWGDALSERDDARLLADEARCRDVLAALGERDTAYAALRALEPRTVDEVARRVAWLARRDAADDRDARTLVAVLYGIADAERETMHARRAADRVKVAEASEPDAGRRAETKRDAESPLRQSAATLALFNVDAGDLTGDARALALLVTLDRMEIARGLPMHLKVYAVEGIFAKVFGVAPPSVPEDASRPMKKGAWLAYLSEVAARAGHPVPDAATAPVDRETVAWTSVAEGFADRLRAEAPRVSSATELAEVVARVVERLDGQYETARTRFAAAR